MRNGGRTVSDSRQCVRQQNRSSWPSMMGYVCGGRCQPGPGHDRHPIKSGSRKPIFIAQAARDAGGAIPRHGDDHGNDDIARKVLTVRIDADNLLPYLLASTRGSCSVWSRRVATERHDQCRGCLSGAGRAGGRGKSTSRMTWSTPTTRSARTLLAVQCRHQCMLSIRPSQT